MKRQPGGASTGLCNSESDTVWRLSFNDQNRSLGLIPLALAGGVAVCVMSAKSMVFRL